MRSVFHAIFATCIVTIGGLMFGIVAPALNAAILLKVGFWGVPLTGMVVLTMLYVLGLLMGEWRALVVIEQTGGR